MVTDGNNTSIMGEVMLNPAMSIYVTLELLARYTLRQGVELYMSHEISCTVDAVYTLCRRTWIV